jgi:exosortase/archaeosortase family protein
LNQILAFVLFKFMTMPILTLDAMLTAKLLQLLTGVGAYEANTIIGGAGHEVLVIRGCSSITNLSLGLLLWFAVIRTRADQFDNRHVLGMLLMGVAIVALNVIRLMLMAVDLNWHGWFHQNSGLLAYQASYASILLVFIYLGLRRA